jgi:hypothetical protein
MLKKQGGIWATVKLAFLAQRILQHMKDFILSFDADKDGNNPLTRDFFAQIPSKKA